MFGLASLLGTPSQKPEDAILSQFNATGSVPGSMLNSLFPVGPAPMMPMGGIDPFATSTGPYVADPTSVFSLGGNDPQASQRGMADAYEAMLRDEQAKSAMKDAQRRADDASIQQLIAQAQADSSAWGSGPSMMADPSIASAFGRIDSTLDEMQGYADQFRPRQAPLGQSSSYYRGVTHGGTGAMNDRFERLWDQDALQASVAAGLAADPQFGHLFQNPGTPHSTSNDLGGAGMTFFGSTPSNEVSPAYLARTQMTALDFPTNSAGRELGGLAGSRVSFKTPEAEAAFRAAREERQAREAQQREDYYHPRLIDMLSPQKALDYMGNWQAMQGKNRQQAAQFGLDQRQLDADIAIKQREQELRELGYTNEQARAKAEQDLAERRFRLEEKRTDAEIEATKQGSGLGLTVEQIMAGLNQYRMQFGQVEGEKRYFADLASAKAARSGKAVPGASGLALPSATGGSFVSTGSTPTKPDISHLLDPSNRRTITNANGEEVLYTRDPNHPTHALLPRTAITVPEGKDIGAIYRDPWGNAGDYVNLVAPPSLKDSLDSKFGSTSVGLFEGFDPMRQLDIELDYVTNPDGTPLSPAQKSAFRRYYWGMTQSGGGWTDAAMLYDY